MDTEFLKKVGQQAEPRQRFIRTFLTDSATVKEGGVPDFTPVTMEEEGIEAVVPQLSEEIPATAPAKQKEPDPTPPPVQEEPPALEREAPPPPPPKPEPKPAPQKPEGPPPLHTFATDFSDRIKETKASTATILTAEGNAPRKPQPAPRAQSNSLAYVLAGLLLLLLGGGGVYGVYVYLNLETPLPTIFDPTVPAPIFVNEREKLTGTGPELRIAVAASAQKPLEANSARLLHTETAATSTDTSLFHALLLPAPDILLRNVEGTGSMVGIGNAGGVTAPFFILEVSSYADTFAGMLSWEPRIAKDLASFFPPKGEVGGEATSTPSNASSPLFKDEVIANFDTRVLRATTGETVLLYGYWSPEVLLIAQNEATFRLLTERLNTSRTSR